MQEIVTDATREAIQAFFPTVPAAASGADPVEDRDTLTLHGTLEYQACDDAICYNPVSVPLTWTVTLRRYAAGVER